MGIMARPVIDGFAPMRRAWCTGRLAVALVPAAGLLLWVAAARPATPQNARGAPAQDTTETELAIRVRRALLQDEALASINLGVTVRDGIVILWGPIASAELAREALTKAGHVTGVREVRSELSIVSRDGDAGETPAVVATNQLSPSAPLVTDKVSPAPGALTGRPGATEPAPAVTSVSLMPPIAVSGPAPDTSRPPPASLGHPVPLPPIEPKPTVTAPPDLSAAIDGLRRGDGRFARIEWEVRDRVVTLRGAVGRGEDLMAFAQAVARLPGVERVVLGQVQINPPAGSR